MPVTQENIESGASAGSKTSLSQATYRGTPYNDSAWEVVGEPPKSLTFEPMPFQVIAEGEKVIDPMFADYGGVEKGKAKLRWHLPKGVVYAGPQEEQEAAVEEEQGVKLTEDELQQLQSTAFQQGYEEGQKLAQETVAQEKSKMERTIVQAFKDLQVQVDENVASLEKRAVELALQVSKKIIEQSVEINPEYVVQVIKEAIGLSGTAVVKNIRVSPQDYEFIEVVGLAKDLKKEDSVWEFTADPAIKAGCVVETSAGEIDYQLDVAWERIKNKVVRLLK